MQHYKSIWDKLAYALSIALYPLWMSTYIMVLFCRVFSLTVMPLPFDYACLAIGGTLLFTGLMPLTILFVMIKHGKVTNLDVTNRKERTIPYIYTLGCIACWCFFLHKLHMPQYIVWSSVATLLVLILVMLITLRWKISVHLSSMGGAVAMVIGIMLQCGVYRTWIVMLLLVVSWLLMLARIRLEAHTPAQTVAGFLLGLITVMIPNIILAYAA